MSGSEAADRQAGGGSSSRPQGSDLESPCYAQGFRIEDPSTEELREALEAAVDYRGDVTLRSRGGEEVVGYIYNREVSASDPYVELLIRGDPTPRSVLFRDIREILFSGRDTASGKSWETWVKNYEAKRAARARGEDVGRIEIAAEDLKTGDEDL